MKKYILILIALFPILLNSQNYEPEQAYFEIPAVSQSAMFPLSGSLDYFQQTSFLRGNHWDTSPRLEKAVGYNQKDIYNDNYIGNDASKLNDGTLLHVKMKYKKPGDTYYTSYWTHCRGPELLNARGIEYSPILEINPSLSHTLQTVPTSSRNPIFGFQTIVGTKDYENDCLLIDTSLKDSVILEEPWTADQLSYYEGPDEWDPDERELYTKDFLCRGMYITINLRRDDFSEDMTNDAVLKIEIPHTYI